LHPRGALLPGWPAGAGGRPAAGGGRPEQRPDPGAGLGRPGDGAPPPRPGRAGPRVSAADAPDPIAGGRAVQLGLAGGRPAGRRGGGAAGRITEFRNRFHGFVVIATVNIRYFLVWRPLRRPGGGRVAVLVAKGGHDFGGSHGPGEVPFPPLAQGRRPALSLFPDSAERAAFRSIIETRACTSVPFRPQMVRFPRLARSRGPPLPPPAPGPPPPAAVPGGRRSWRAAAGGCSCPPPSPWLPAWRRRPGPASRSATTSSPSSPTTRAAGRSGPTATARSRRPTWTASPARGRASSTPSRRRRSARRAGPAS